MEEEHILCFAVLPQSDQEMGVVDGLYLAVYDYDFDPTSRHVDDPHPPVPEVVRKAYELFQARGIPTRQELEKSLGEDNVLTGTALIRFLQDNPRFSLHSGIIWDDQHGHCFEFLRV
jgi:hypothetical protein